MFSQPVHKSINSYVLCIWVCSCIYQLLHKFHVVIIAGIVERCPALSVWELSKWFWSWMSVISSVCVHNEMYQSLNCMTISNDQALNSVMYCHFRARDCKMWYLVFNLSVRQHADYVPIYLTAYICTSTIRDDYDCNDL